MEMEKDARGRGRLLSVNPLGVPTIPTGNVQVALNRAERNVLKPS